MNDFTIMARTHVIAHSISQQEILQNHLAVSREFAKGKNPSNSVSRASPKTELIPMAWIYQLERSRRRGP
jgi:hypothetical protein